MGVKLHLLVIFVSLLVTLTQSRDICKFSTNHKLPQVTCSNFNATPGWKNHIPVEPKLEKLIFRNVTGSIDLSNFTLHSLRYLLISHSQVEDFTFGNFPELIFLTVLKNKKFPNLTQDLFLPATHINWLSLVSNSHTIEPNAFHLLKNLTWLHIQNQKFEHLTAEFFQESTNLHELSLRNCHLQKIEPNAFDRTANLEILSMNFNKLRHFEGGTFKNLRNLKILELHHNKFVRLSLDQFRGLSSVEVLGLPSHFLKSVNCDELLVTFPNLEKMEMRKKDLRHGDVRQLIQRLRKKEVDIIGTPHDCHDNHDISVSCNSMI